jgi:hypothetical protein
MMAETAKRTPSRAQQLAGKKQTHVECRGYGHKLEGTMQTFRRKRENDELVYVGFRMRRVVCVRNEDGPCGYWAESVYDGQWGHRPDLSRSGYDKNYGIKGQGRGRYRVEALQELAAREGI